METKEEREDQRIRVDLPLYRKVRLTATLLNMSIKDFTSQALETAIAAAPVSIPEHMYPRELSERTS